MTTTEDKKLVGLLPKFHECHDYADRLAFWDKHWEDMLQSDYEDRKDVQLHHYVHGVDLDLDTGKKSISPVRSWEDMQQLPILSLTPFTQANAQLFVDWALQRRPGMNRAPESIETKKMRFIKQYLAIPSDLDRKEYLQNARETAYAWKNNQVGNLAWRANFEQEFGIDFKLLGYFASQNKLSQQINLARYVSTFDLQMNWVVIDTYLFAQNQYEYAIFLEHFEPQKAILKSRQPNREITSAVHQVDYEEVISRILAPLDGLNHSNIRIMSEANFRQLVEYTTHLAIIDSVPTIDKPFPELAISTRHIRYTFYRLHKELFGTSKIRPAFIDFLHTAFSQFDNWEWLTTKAQFSIAPKSYKKDFGLSD
jgi:hypothetical protein